MAECFWPDVTEQAVADAGIRSYKAAAASGTDGGVARYLDSILVPSDEIALCFFEADSMAAALEINRRASIPFERILEVVRIRPPSSTQPTTERNKND